VQGAVEFAVAASVEAVADRLARGGWDRSGAGEPRERGLVRKASVTRAESSGSPNARKRLGSEGAPRYLTAAVAT
jgi:hypothetical protein